MKIKTEPTVVVQVFIAGDIQAIRQACRAYCDKIGMCVSVEQTTFVYTGGQEGGASIRFVNYPRFPTSEAAIMEKAQLLATALIEDLEQTSALIVGPTETNWLTERAEDQ